MTQPLPFEPWLKSAPVPVVVVYPTGSAMGEIGQEKPYTPYPWVDEEPTEEEVKKQKRAELWEKVGMAVGLLGGVMGVVLSYRALRGGG